MPLRWIRFRRRQGRRRPVWRPGPPPQPRWRGLRRSGASLVLPDWLAGARLSTEEPATRRGDTCVIGERVAPSAHPGGAELDGDPRADRPGRLRHAVVPGALARAPHDDEVAVPGGHLGRRAAAPRAFFY